MYENFINNVYLILISDQSQITKINHNFEIIINNFIIYLFV
jgi:hypothetical protein